MTLAEDLAFALDPTAETDDLLNNSGLYEQNLFEFEEDADVSFVPTEPLSHEDLRDLMAATGLDAWYTEADFAALLQEAAGLPARYLVVANPLVGLRSFGLTLFFRAGAHSNQNRLVRLVRTWGLHNPTAAQSIGQLADVDDVRSIFYYELLSQLPLSRYVQAQGFDDYSVMDVMSMILLLVVETNPEAGRDLASSIRGRAIAEGISGISREVTIEVLRGTQTKLIHLPGLLRMMIDQPEDMASHDSDVAWWLRGFFVDLYKDRADLGLDTILGPLTFANALADEIGAPRPRHFLERIL